MTMICESCKSSAATVHLKKIVGSTVTESYLCKQCADKENTQGDVKKLTSGFLTAFADIKSPASAEKAARLKCPDCGQSLADFKKQGRLGCSRCYTVLESGLKGFLEKVHGHTHHVGKSPKGKYKDFEAKRHILGLQNELQESVKAEDYEKAAQLRDRIRQFEENR